MSERRDRRWPSSIYGAGSEPDPRFTLANERTLLAWIRTALALVGAGVVIDAVDIDVSEAARRVVGAILVSLGGLAAAAAWLRWAATERALRHARPLPGAVLTIVLVAGLVVAVWSFGALTAVAALLTIPVIIAIVMPRRPVDRLAH